MCNTKNPNRDQSKIVQNILIITYQKKAQLVRNMGKYSCINTSKTKLKEINSTQTNSKTVNEPVRQKPMNLANIFPQL